MFVIQLKSITKTDSYSFRLENDVQQNKLDKQII